MVPTSLAFQLIILDNPIICKQLTCHVSLCITNDLSLRIRATSCHIPSQASLQVTVQLLFSNHHALNTSCIDYNSCTFLCRSHLFICSKEPRMRVERMIKFIH